MSEQAPVSTDLATCLQRVRDAKRQRDTASRADEAAKSAWSVTWEQLARADYELRQAEIALINAVYGDEVEG